MKCLSTVVLGCALIGALQGLSSCSKSSSGSGHTVLAEATIDQNGGVVRVDGGYQSGLQLTVPPGVVAGPTLFRIIDDSVSLPEELRPTSYLAPVGYPISIEPTDLAIPLDATLRLPYRPGVMTELAPGNVRALQTSPFATREYEPTAIDVIEGHFDIAIRTFGRFDVVRGPRVGSLINYVQSQFTTARFPDGYAVEFRSVPAPSPFVAAGGFEWRITGPGIDESLVFVGQEIVGRRGQAANWREQWSDTYDPWLPVAEAQGGGITTTTTITTLLGSQPAQSGQITAYGFRQYAIPRTYDGRLLLDVIKLNVELAWDRLDLGVGQRQLIFWFARGEGLIELSIDGVLRQRIPD